MTINVTICCIFQQDAESVAESLATMSDGKIKTGVYHAEIPDGRKEALHRQWREGKVKVVCATIGTSAHIVTDVMRAGI